MRDITAKSVFSQCLVLAIDGQESVLFFRDTVSKEHNHREGKAAPTYAAQEIHLSCQKRRMG